jgi:hypothetical protein
MRICECFIHAFSHCPVAPPAMLYRRGWGRTSHLSAPAAGERQIRRRRCVALSRVHVRDAALLWRRPWLVIGPHPCARGFGSQAKVQWHQGKSFVSTLSLHRAVSRMGEAPNQSVGLPIFHACEGSLASHHANKTFCLVPQCTALAERTNPDQGCAGVRGRPRIQAWIVFHLGRVSKINIFNVQRAVWEVSVAAQIIVHRRPWTPFVRF